MILWTVAGQIPLSIEFLRQEYWNGLPFPSPRDFPEPGIEPGSPALQADSLPSEPPGKTKWPKSKTLRILNVCENVKQLEHSYTAAGNTKLYSHFSLELPVPNRPVTESLPSRARPGLGDMFPSHSVKAQGSSGLNQMIQRSKEPQGSALCSRLPFNLHSSTNNIFKNYFIEV